MQALISHNSHVLTLGPPRVPLRPVPLLCPIHTLSDRPVSLERTGVVTRVSAETKEAKREAKKEAKKAKKEKSRSPSAQPVQSPPTQQAVQAEAQPQPQAQAQQQSEEAPPPPSSIEVLDDAADTGRGAAGSSGISSGVRLQNISVTFKNQQVLTNCSWEVKKGERVGLVGVNGAGKTTQLQIIQGKVQQDAGEVIKAKRNMKIAYLAQEFDVDPKRTVREEFYQVYDQQVRAVKRQEQLSAQLESAGEDMARMQAILDELDKLNNKVMDMDVELLDKKIDQMMPELGFRPEDNDRLVASYSGGWQMRMCLGKMLLQEPDLLLLDEPTNHLDLDAVEWLEGYLKQQEVPMVVVSHDREFLDQVCTKIVETERGVSQTFNGNYTQFVNMKSERWALQWVAWEKQQKEIEKQKEIIQRLSGGSQSGRAGQAQKVLDRIKEEGLVPKPFVSKKRSFTFPSVEKMGQRVVSIQNLTHGYGGQLLFKDVSLEIEKGDRVAIIGPNGAGKSTLLRLIMGKEQPQSGSVRMGEYNIVPNYFEQNQAEALDPNLTVLNTLIQAAPDAKLSDLKTLLGRMLFSGPAVDKKVGVLSGGEKARLALAKFMCTQGTLLVLDEPTNHLDIPSKEMLEEAIQAFEGSVIAVSHDRYFLRKIATRILLAEDRQLKDFKGDYSYYLEQNEDEAAKMIAKEAKAKEIEKSNIKAKSKMTKAEKEKMKKDKAKEFHATKASKKK
mmetsp:Transcript_4201/g.11356  ORF Transcript_4201/g.11356 Transcript_4201/m.11356 type:complete len:726 (+) Transcript_4201:1136-3313(+)|eukprot:CAMPEP_0202375382 /NCGR_PEP_ID=MMETSP1127-20130417/6061_1 /ASSEMBLY_ACC=CAM_ASM_000462 /TAXON_ID=3047 /ORGANISM="Dunaliella tertiolecta, Strain CCMP1320" /LENGTH=725 /DNA_ID=CAMNT_0048972833 /DNA_START=1076 /DNA_END=3253 /DNA_ORIENTATION=-